MSFKIETDDQFRPTTLTISNGEVTLLIAKGDKGDMSIFQIASAEKDERGHYKNCLNLHLPEGALQMLKAVVANM